MMSGTGSSNTPDVMISYNLESKEAALKIRDNLQQNGITCWIDVDVEADIYMAGSLQEAIAVAIENCTVFLTCYSEKYSQSKLCEKEAEYANSRKKTIISCNLEADFDPSGTLNTIIGSKLLFDFSGKYPFEKQMEKLIREIRLHLKDNANQARML